MVNGLTYTNFHKECMTPKGGSRYYMTIKSFNSLAIVVRSAKAKNYAYIEIFPKLSSTAVVNSVISDDVTAIVNKLPVEVNNSARRKQYLIVFPVLNQSLVSRPLVTNWWLSWAKPSPQFSVIPY